MALTLPSSNGASFLTARPENIQLNTHFNGGLTQTTATVTPTRLKNIEETFLEHSLLPPKPFQHQHMAGFVTPSVNISFFVKPTNNLNQQPQQDKALDYFNSSISNSNSNDSLAYNSDDYNSETSSSAVENSNYSFSNLIVDMNNSSSRGKRQSTSVASNSKQSRGKSKSKSISSMASTSQQQTKPKKSTGGGRKPNKIDKLTPEEEQKRAKRRERNKLAAARCRKRRLDQTNTLMDKTRDLEADHETLVERLQTLLTHMNALKRHIEEHERRNCNKKHIKLATDLFGSLNFEALTEAMKPQYEEDSMSEMQDDDGQQDDDDDDDQISIKQEIDAPPVAVISAATSVIVPNNNVTGGMFNFGSISNPLQHFQFMPSTFGNNSAETNGQTITPPKRKRPNTLPVSSSYKVNPSDIFAATSSSSLTSNSNALQTPSNGLLFENWSGGTGLTPLVPSLTPSELTPSTMAAFVKSLTSPSMDDSEQKKLILI